MTHASENPVRDTYAEELAGRFRSVLDQHGHSFQFAVIRKLQQIFERQQRWLLEVAEFPTSTGHFDTRIDFIIRPQGTRFFLAAECKRANPALNDWCFVQSPFVRRGRSDESLFVEEVIADFSEGTPERPARVHARGRALDPIGRAYHIGFEVKNSRNKGEATGSMARRAIEEAAGQVLKGVNGLVAILAEQAKPEFPDVLSPRNTVRTLLMPAIVTTAKLWTSDVDLSNASLSTGALPCDALGQMEQRPWIHFQYPMSPALKHSLPSGPFAYEFADMLDPHYMRTIAIINADGLEEFCTMFRPTLCLE